ncbi:helical backbone metal receptor, partial [Streptomyces sp. G44]|uniref:helical backbone metal receptor n=1 Tax=Streptomyces sp. G44 TaxID=2807632 RepID=UPI0027DC1530
MPLARTARVVSLVPSLTEAVAVTVPGALVGATDWCSHPADLDVVRVGGTKNPDVPRIIALAPDLVIANEEENRAPDLAALRASGIEVLVTEVRSLDQAFRELHRVLAACGAGQPPPRGRCPPRPAPRPPPPARSSASPRGAPRHTRPLPYT